MCNSEYVITYFLSVTAKTGRGSDSIKPALLVGFYGLLLPTLFKFRFSFAFAI